MKDCGDFHYDLFKDPPALFWPAYGWVWNDKLDEEKLLAQLSEMRAHDVRSICIIPEPPEFRPQTFGTLMEPEYLGADYCELYAKILKECARLGMIAWLYDEGGWPSGGAAGRVYSRNPIAHCRKALRFREMLIGPADVYQVPEELVCAAVLENGNWKTYLPGDVVRVTSEGTRLRTFFMFRQYEPDGGRAAYADMLCPSAVNTFIEVTYGRLKEYAGSYFGRVVPFAFTDEPSVLPTRPSHQLTWTDDMVEAFCAHKGYDLRPLLPMLMEPPSDSESAGITLARIDFYDVWSRLFVERYVLPLRDWCRENDILFGGHFGGEDEPGHNSEHGYGHILRCLRAMDLPGVDTIWRQLFPGVRSHNFPRYASSAARQMGSRFACTESFAVYGNGLTPAEMKWITDQQYVRGLNLLVAMIYPYSTRDHLMPGERPHFGPRDPLWPYLDIYNAYVARMSYLLSRGKPACDVAVYFDIRGIWAGASTRKRAIRLHEEVAEALCRSQIDFDFIDDDILCEAESRCEGGRLCAGDVCYGTIIVPAAQWLEKEALDRLVQYVGSGGVLIAVEELPAAGGGETDVMGVIGSSWSANAEEFAFGDGRILLTSVQELPTHVEHVVTVEPQSSHLRVCRRELGERRLYFITNEANETVRTRLIFSESSDAVLLDPETGGGHALSAERVRGGMALEIEFGPWGSKVIVFGEPCLEPEPVFVPGRKFLELDVEWSLRPLWEFSVGDHDYEMQEINEDRVYEARLGDWRGCLGEHFSGQVEYRAAFSCDAEWASCCARLELGRVLYACEVILNGQSIGRRAWKPFSFDIDGRLKSGLNDLRVLVSNTCANAILKPEIGLKWNAMQGPGWPSNGLFYDTQAREFEKGSLPSGLFGPVRIVFGERR